MRGKSTLLAAIGAAMSMAAASGAAVSSAGVGSPALQAVSPSTPRQRRSGNGPGTKAHQRAARKARNVQRNRKAHRG